MDIKVGTWKWSAVGKRNLKYGINLGRWRMRICSFQARKLKWADSLPSYKEDLVPIKAVMLGEMEGVIQNECVGCFLLLSVMSCERDEFSVQLATERLLAEIESDIALLRDAMSGLQVLNPGWW